MLVTFAQDSGHFIGLREYWQLFWFIFSQKFNCKNVLYNNSLFIASRTRISLNSMTTEWMLFIYRVNRMRDIKKTREQQKIFHTFFPKLKYSVYFWLHVLHLEKLCTCAVIPDLQDLWGKQMDYARVFRCSTKRSVGSEYEIGSNFAILLIKI